MEDETPVRGAAAVVQPSNTEDAKEIVQGVPYHWKDWCVARGRDCLYIWSEAAALELSNGSNGWFRFILDGKLATMYSSGSPEGGSDSSGETTEWLLSSSFSPQVIWGRRCSDHLSSSMLPCLLVVCKVKQIPKNSQINWIEHTRPTHSPIQTFCLETHHWHGQNTQIITTNYL